MDRASACCLQRECIVLQKKPEFKKPNIVSWTTQVHCLHKKTIFPKLFCTEASLQKQFKPKAVVPCQCIVQTQSIRVAWKFSFCCFLSPLSQAAPYVAHRATLATFSLVCLTPIGFPFISTPHIMWEFILGIQIQVSFPPT